MSNGHSFFRSNRTSCGECMFFDRIKIGEANGRCHGVPPTPILVGMAQRQNGDPVPVVNTYPPQVPDTYWCGVWQPKASAMAQIDAAALEHAVAEGEA